MPLQPLQPHHSGNAVGVWLPGYADPGAPRLPSVLSSFVDLTRVHRLQRMASIGALRYLAPMLSSSADSVRPCLAPISKY